GEAVREALQAVRELEWHTSGMRSGPQVFGPRLDLLPVREEVDDPALLGLREVDEDAPVAVQACVKRVLPFSFPLSSSASSSSRLGPKPQSVQTHPEMTGVDCPDGADGASCWMGGAEQWPLALEARLSSSSWSARRQIDERN
ncbi:hypothetical protein THAOC_19928, partial [Thalassiosira oceanica]